MPRPVGWLLLRLELAVGSLYGLVELRVVDRFPVQFILRPCVGHRISRVRILRPRRPARSAAPVHMKKESVFQCSQDAGVAPASAGIIHAAKSSKALYILMRSLILIPAIAPTLSWNGRSLDGVLHTMIIVLPWRIRNRTSHPGIKPNDKATRPKND